MTLYYVIVICGLAAAEFIRARGSRKALILWCVFYGAAGAAAGLWLGGVSF
ncbi:MAG: hypothetical protein IKZ19_09515 [Clostridia bacterium]|nr:hypothetical protein [Clostridia bacterium]